MILNPNCSEAVWRINLSNLTEDEKNQLKNLLTRIQDIAESGASCSHEGPEHHLNGKIDVNQKLGDQETIDDEEVKEIQEKWYDTSWWEETIFKIPVIIIRGETPYNCAEWLEDKLRSLPFGEKLEIEGGET